MDVSIDYLRHLLAQALWHDLVPLKAVELQIEVRNKHGVSEVDEGEPHTLAHFEIHGQIKVVKLTVEILVDKSQQVLLHHLHWDVLDHQSGQAHHFSVIVLFRIQDSEQVNVVDLRPRIFLLLVFALTFLEILVKTPWNMLFLLRLGLLVLEQERNICLPLDILIIGIWVKR